jgi:hypothetical protein
MAQFRYNLKEDNMKEFKYDTRIQGNVLYERYNLGLLFYKDGTIIAGAKTNSLDFAPGRSL